MPSKPTFRAGDVVRHHPTGEEWVVAATNPATSELVCCGWPETIAPFSSCTLVKAATDDEHKDTLSRVIKSGPSLRSSWASNNLGLFTS